MRNAEIGKLIKALQKTEHGFKHIQDAAEKIVAQETTVTSLQLSKGLFKHKEYQARMLAVFILGYIAAQSKESLKILKEKVSLDDNWRVQEILAKAFDTYCSTIGYENALPTIKEWLQNKNPNVRRAVTEGLRIWTSRSFFKENPDVAIKLLSRLRADESEYVRKSVGNALRDISKSYKPLVKSELATWSLSDKNITQTYKLASRFLGR